MTEQGIRRRRSAGWGVGMTEADTGGKGATAPTGHRPMTHEDVGKVILAFKQLGPEKFFKGFVRSQQIIHREGGKPTKVVLREYYVSFDQLRNSLFADVNMSDLGQMYRDLTLALDQSMMRGYVCFADEKEPFSINLNVQSALSKNFEVFLARMPLNLLTIEFRQSNIVEYFDEFLIVRGMLEAKGIKFAVDHIFPDTLGLVNIDYIGAKTAKVQWVPGAEEVLKGRARAIKHMTESGVAVVMTRVEDAATVALANSLGIYEFQGYLVDDILKKAAA
jgi:hypothetical protein